MYGKSAVLFLIQDPEGEHEILFNITEDAAKQLMDLVPLEDCDELDEYTKELLMSHLRELHLCHMEK